MALKWSKNSRAETEGRENKKRKGAAKMQEEGEKKDERRREKIEQQYNVAEVKNEVERKEEKTTSNHANYYMATPAESRPRPKRGGTCGVARRL